MPKYRITAPDGGTYEVTAPEGASEAEVLAYAKQNYESTAKQTAQPAAAPSHPAEGMSVGERALVGMGRGASGVYQGIKQLGLQAGEAIGAVQPGTADAYTRSKQEEHDLYDRYSAGLGTAGKVGEFAGSALALPVPGAGAGAGLVGRLSGAAVVGAAQGGAEFVPEGGSRVRNAAIGAAVGTGFQGVIGEPLRAGVNKFASLALGGKSSLSDNALKAVEYAKANGLPIFYDDVAGSASARAVGTFTDDLPFVGTGSTRRRQADAAGQAASELVGRFDTGASGRVADTLKDSAENQLARAKGIKNELRSIQRPSSCPAEPMQLEWAN